MNQILAKGGKHPRNADLLSPLSELEKTLNEEFKGVERMSKLLGEDADVADNKKIEKKEQNSKSGK